MVVVRSAEGNNLWETFLHSEARRPPESVSDAGWEVVPHKRDRQRGPTSPLHREPLNCWCSDVCSPATRYICRPKSRFTRTRGWLSRNVVVTLSA